MKYFCKVLEAWAPTSCSLEDRRLRAKGKDKKNLGPVGKAGIGVAPPHLMTCSTQGIEFLPVGSLSYILCTSAPSPLQLPPLRPTSFQTLAGREAGGRSRPSVHRASHPPTGPPLHHPLSSGSADGMGCGALPQRNGPQGYPLGNDCEGDGCVWEGGVSGCGMRTPACERGWGGGGVGR